ncbi:hypothetical protein RI444_15295 [Paenarthrobacter sp. AT5]|nr:hypothetical protein [Paenarthrobacter sp. AT5]WOC59872.1 hypothetical protein RI444_15295 [Paenarthrobacter sp. AT5]
MSPREIALAAYTPGGPSLEQLEKLAEARLLGQSVRGIITPPKVAREAAK